MAVTTVQTNNKLVKYTQEINREYVRGNLFSPYMGTALNSIIRIKNELKAGGEEMNIPLVTRLTGAGVSTGTLVGNEESIDNYGMRVRLDWARHAVVTNKAESQKDSADIFGEAKPLLSDWGKELQRDELISRSWRCRPKRCPRPAPASTASSTIWRPLPSAIPGTRPTRIACCMATRPRTTTRPTPPRWRTATPRTTS
jgi:hypothetical protein